MTKKSNFLKNLLTTASVLAVTTSAGSANAAAIAGLVQNDPAQDATLVNGAGANLQDSDENGVNFANGNSFRFSSAGKTITAGGDVIIGAIDLNNFNPGNLLVTNNVELSAVIDSSGNNMLDAVVTDGMTLSLKNVNGVSASGAVVTGGTFTNLGNITLGTANAGTAKLLIDVNGATLTGTINGDAANKGIIEVNAANVVFNGSIGDTKAIGTLDIKAGKSTTLAKTGDNKINAVIIGTGSTFDIAAGANIASATIDSDAPNKGILRFAGNSTAAIDKLGNAKSLETVEIGNGTVNFKTTTDFKATKTHLTGANSVIQFSANKAVSETDFTTAVNGEGKLIFADFHILKGNIGAAGAAIGTVQVNDGKGLLIIKDDGKLYADAVTSTGNDTSVLAIQGNNFEIHSDIGTPGNPFGGVLLLGNATGNAAATVKLMAGKSIHGDLDLANTNALDNILELYENSSITGDVGATQANNGILSVKGNATIDGKIVDAAAVVGGGGTINQIRFDEAATLTVTKNTVETNNGINFTKDGTLALTEDADFNFNQDIAIAKGDNGTGAITVNSAGNGKTVTLTGAIGDVNTKDKALRLVEVTGGANIVLDGGDAAIKRINIGSQDVELKLSHAGEYLINDFSHEEGKGSLNVNADLTLKTGTKLGALNSINVNNNTLTVAKDVNLSTENGIQNTADGNGKLVFEGSSTVSGIVGSNHKFGDVQVTGKDSTVDFLSKFNSNGSLTISDGATATLRDEVVAAKINGAGTNKGTVRFFNATELKDGTAITAKIGNVGNELDTVVLGGANIAFNENAGGGIFNTKNLKFSAEDSKLTATFTELAQNSLQNTIITTDSKTRGHNIVLSKEDQTFDKSVGSVDNKFGDFTLVDAQLITVNNPEFYAGIITETKQKGDVELTANNGNVLNLGSAEKELNDVTFNSNNTTVHEGVWSQTIIVNANKGAIFKGVVASSTGLTLNAGSTALFDGSNSRLETKILANAAGNGTVEFNDTTTISNTIGAAGTQVGAINFTGTKASNVASVGANLSANNINVGAQTFRTTDNIELNGVTTFNDGSVIDLGANNIKLTNGNSRFAGTVTVKSTLNGNNGPIGQFTVDGAVLDAKNATAVNIFITDNADLPAQDENYELFTSANGGNITNITDGTVEGSNRFISWSRNDNIITRKNNAVAAITADIGSTNQTLLTDAVKYGDANNTGDAKGFTGDISKLNSAGVKEAVQRVVNNTAIQAPKVVASVEEATNAVISNRMGALSNHPPAGRQLASSNASGIAAGDDHTMYGAWLSPFYNQTTQKELKGTAGFKSNSYGVTIGFDTQANADLTVGIAGSYVRTDMKHKNFKSGDKTKADSFLFSLYGIQQLSNDWFLQGHTSFSTSRIKNTEKRLTSAGNETAKGNFDTTSYTFELLTGYNYMMADAVVTPLVGASFTRINDGGYKETGTTNQNLNITRKAKNKFEAILGLRAQMTTPMEGIDVTPEIHAFVKHDLIGKDAKVTAKHNGLVNQLSPKSAKAQRTTFNVGFGVNAISGMYEYGAGYDLHVAEKSLGHQGTIKVRLNF